MDEYKRIRVIFKDDDILSEAQKLEGLSRSWLMLKPHHQHATVSDIASHLLQAFQLHHSCPNGLLLSNSGFVLPQFESASILKDDEVIRVKKRRNVLSVEGINAANDLQKLESVEGQPVNTGVLLLANNEFEKEKGGYESDDTEEESEEEAKEDLLHGTEDPSGSKKDPKNRKRKAPEKHKGSKKKKQRSETPEVVVNDAGTPTKRKRPSQKEKKVKFNDEDNIERNEESATLSVKNDVSMTDVKRNDEVQENSKETDAADIAPKETKKGPSRSSRRKYAKRIWLREMAKIQKTASESEGLRNWNMDHAKAERKEDHAKAVRNKYDQSNGPKWKRQQADMEKTEVDGQPKGLLHWSESPQNSPLVKGKIRRQRNQYVHCHPNHYGDAAETISSTRTFSKEAEALVKEALQEQKDQLLHQKKPNQNGDKAREIILVGYGDEQSNQDGGMHEQTNKGNTDVCEHSSQQTGDAQQQPDKNGNASERSNQESDEESEVVPIVIRPGHIRFEPLGKEQAVQQNHELPETFQWNGITSKKKGQKWGTEKYPFSPQNDHESSNKDCSESSSNKKEKQLDRGIDFDKLPSLPSTPREGDLIAYRVLELSSSWTPELSAYRIGKVSYFNAESNKTMLVPVSDYPLVTQTDEDEAVQLDSSLYKEDGSLEIDFSSLVDVRTLKHGISGPINVASSHVSEVSLGKENTPKPVLPSSNGEQGLQASAVVGTGQLSQGGETQPTVAVIETRQSSQGKETQSPAEVIETEQSSQGRETQSPAAGGVDPWDQISEALNAKKAELATESSWGKPPKKLQAVQHNTWVGKNANNLPASPVKFLGRNGKNAQHSPVNNSWGKNAKSGQPWQGNSGGKNDRSGQPLQENSWGKNGKNGQPSQENSWGKQNSWSYKALRGSGLGQTMDMLRSKQDM